MLAQTDIRRVIVVVLDGLRPDAIDAFDLANLRRLVRVGAATLGARTVQPSLTWPALTSLLTGVAPETHGILADSLHLPRARAALEPLPELLLRAEYPSSAFMRALPGLYRMFGHRVAERLGFTSARFMGDTAAEVLLPARPTLREQRRGLVFFHWADADRAGHEHGWMSGEYGEAARRLDCALGTLCAATIESDAHTLLIALADHGGGGIDPRHHQGEHPLNATIPLVLAGCGVQRRALGDVSLLDVPATVAWALGVMRPASYEGRELTEAFEVQEESAVA